MALREDLLDPIAGDNPAGADLYYDPVFGQIKEARREDADDGTDGAWELAQKKKADHRTVIKLAGDALAKRSKDLRLAGSLVESQMRIDGFAVLAPAIELLRGLQEKFWANLYPLPDEGEDYELRMIAVETAARGIVQSLEMAPLTRNGLSYMDYLESRRVGYEADATSDSKRESRQDAIEHGKLTAEDFDQAFASTPKSFYVTAAEALSAALAAVDRLDEYDRQAYPVDSPNLAKLRQSVELVHLTVESLLNERRKTEPDAVQAAAEPPAEAAAEEEGLPSAGPGDTRPVQAAALRPRAAAGQLSQVEDAYAQVVESALYLFQRAPQSPVPYLICSGLRLGETRMQGESPAPGFAVGPSAEVRQMLRTLANKGAWNELLCESLPVLASECARAWLDLHRYIWNAAQETGAEAISGAVVGTVRSLLMIRPELRHWTLEDDTGAANPETQRWLDSVVLQ
jgi:type VI secretion system protein ImpA